VIDFQNGLNLITGINIDNPERKNAVGKSAIIEAYYYALFGTTIRDIKKDFCINNVTKGSGNIELLFTVQTDTATNSYKIVRQLKPSTVHLYKLGDVEEDISKDSISNTNKYICDLIGSNPVICKSCDILSLSDNIPFMAKKPEEKRKFIEDIFSLEIFGKMLKDLKEDIKNNKSEMSVSFAKKEEIGNSLETLNKQLDAQKKQAEEREEVLKKRKEELEEKIESVKNEIENLDTSDTSDYTAEIEKLESALKQVRLKIRDSGTAIFTKMGKKNMLEEELDKSYVIKVGVKCSYCLQDIPHTHTEVLEELKGRIEGEIEELTAGLKLAEIDKKSWEKKEVKIEDRLEQLELTISKIAHNKNKKINLDNSLGQYLDSLKNLNFDITSVSNNLESFEESIQSTIDRKDEEELKYSNLKQTADDLEVCKFILGEEGVKSFILKRLLDMLNSSIQNYITKLGMSMRCKFDEYFDEKITNDKGKDISYWNFSGGERRTVDIACAWAFKDIKKKISGISSNVEWSDEIFDAAFDNFGLDLLIEVLKTRIENNNMSCYAISHRNETLKHINGEIVNIEKEYGITRRIIK
jgi:DNA repair exonuclease SbcCD ATPase subunit